MTNDHDWERRGMGIGARTEIVRGQLVVHPPMFEWRCRNCKALVRANDSAGEPGTITLILAGRADVSCAETVLLREIHNS